MKEDFTQFNNLAEKNPEKLKELQEEFSKQAKDNLDWPIGAGIWLRLHPEDAIASPYTSFTFDQNSTRMPEFSAPGLGKRSNKVVVDMEVGANASGVIYAMGGDGGGICRFPMRRMCVCIPHHQ